MSEKEEILNETLYKKNKELESIKKLNEEIKREYDEKIKNLEGSIATLKKQNAEMYAQAQDNKRIEIIEKIKSERKEQEQIITLIRNMINNNKDVNLYLTKEFFTKNGDNRKLSYEELKIKIKEKEEELKKLKAKTNTMSMTLLSQNKKGKDKKNKVTDTFLQQKIIEKFKDQINDYDEQINELQEENESLKKSKKEMEDAQNELLEKMKDYNEEVDQMQIKYNLIKDDVKKTATEKINNLNSTIEKLKIDNSKYKKRIVELINKGEKNEQQDKDKLSKMNRDYDIYVKLLQTKEQEIEDYKKELDELKNEIENIDSNELLKITKLENQANELNKDKFNLEADVKNLNNVIQQKDNQIKNLKNTQNALTEEIQIKAQEIILLNEKIAEFEELLKRKSSQEIPHPVPLRDVLHPGADRNGQVHAVRIQERHQLHDAAFQPDRGGRRDNRSGLVQENDPSGHPDPEELVRFGLPASVHLMHERALSVRASLHTSEQSADNTAVLLQ